MNKKHMMKTAHKIAKRIVQHTDNYSIALKYALKEIWRQVKQYDKKRFTEYSIGTAALRIATPKQTVKKDIHGVPTWIIRKNLTTEEQYAVLNECDGATIKMETEKAALVEFHTDYGTVEMWSPKSVMVAA